MKRTSDTPDESNTKKNCTTNSNTVVLDIGGTKFKTTKTTLEGAADLNFFSAMFGGNFQPHPQEDGSIFIDRSGEYFPYILAYLRDGNVVLPKDERAMMCIYQEAKFYQITGLQQDIYAIQEKKAIKDLYLGAITNKLRPLEIVQGNLFECDYTNLICNGTKLVSYTDTECFIYDIHENSIQLPSSGTYARKHKTSGVEPTLGKYYFDISKRKLEVLEGERAVQIRVLKEGEVYVGADWVNPNKIVLISIVNNAELIFSDWNLNDNTITQKVVHKYNPAWGDIWSVYYISSWDAIRIMFDKVGIIAFPDNDVLSLFYPNEDVTTELSFMFYSKEYIGISSKGGMSVYNIKSNKRVFTTCDLDGILEMFGQYLIAYNEAKPDRMCIVDLLDGQVLLDHTSRPWENCHITETDRSWKILLHEKGWIYCNEVEKCQYGL